jgi:hypothetical protein
MRRHPREEHHMSDNRDITEPDSDGLDKYGNPIDGSRTINCCFPDCGCDGARLCQAENGANWGACAINIEQRRPRSTT